MLRSKQTVPGLATANFEVGRFHGLELVAFVSGAWVVVATADLHVLQQLGTGRPIRSVAWAPSGRLAAVLVCFFCGLRSAPSFVQRSEPGS